MLTRCAQRDEDDFIMQIELASGAGAGAGASLQSLPQSGADNYDKAHMLHSQSTCRTTLPYHTPPTPLPLAVQLRFEQRLELRFHGFLISALKGDALSFSVG